MDSPLTFFQFLLKKFPLDTTPPPPRPHVFGKFFIPLVTDVYNSSTTLWSNYAIFGLCRKDSIL